jgi:hypothetical protein
VGEPVGRSAGLEDVPGERQAVDDRSAEPGVDEGADPAGEGLVGGDRDRVDLLAFGEDLEE